MLRITHFLYSCVEKTSTKILNPTRTFNSQKCRCLNSNIPTERVSTPEKVYINYIFYIYTFIALYFSIFLKLELILNLCIFKNCERPRISVDDKTIQLLERLSLVDFANVEGNLCKLDLLYLRSKTIGYEPASNMAIYKRQ